MTEKHLVVESDFFYLKKPLLQNFQNSKFLEIVFIVFLKKMSDNNSFSTIKKHLACFFGSSENFCFCLHKLLSYYS